MTLPRGKLSLPAGCVTGVGSLPFTDPAEAIRFVEDHGPVLPWWPQLPRRAPGEDVIAQGLGALIALFEPADKPSCWQVRRGQAGALGQGLAGEVGLAVETAAGFFAFEAALCGGRFPRAAAVKAQLAGPLTLAHCVFLEGQALAGQTGWLDRLSGFVARQAVWQVNRLKQLHETVVCVVDEPALGQGLAGTPSVSLAALTHVVRAIRAAGAVVGLHCCAPLPAPFLAALDLDWLSFDAHLPVDPGGWLALARPILARAGTLASGLVPTAETKLGVPALVGLWSRQAATLGDPRAVAARTVVTATCGLGLATPAAAAAVFARCARVGEEIGRIALSARS